MGGRENETGRCKYQCVSVFVHDCNERITVTEEAVRNLTLKKKEFIWENEIPHHKKMSMCWDVWDF